MCIQTTLITYPQPPRSVEELRKAAIELHRKQTEEDENSGYPDVLSDPAKRKKRGIPK